MPRLSLLSLALAFALAGMARADDSPASVPAAVISDPAPDPAHPPHSAQILVPSHGAGMNALFYLAGGTGPHPTMVLLHGFPGNEQNLDLAQAIRRAGWNVLTLHYRGAWGSPGKFSIAHVMEDADAAMTFIRRPDIVAKFAIDPARLVLGGHSMGGFASAAHARKDKDLLGVVLIDAWNVGETGRKFAEASGERRAELLARQFDDLGNSLQGATAASTADEVIAHSKDWDYRGWAAALTKRPVLIIEATRGLGAESHQLAEGIVQAGGNVTDIAFASDHSFQDHRIALAAAVVNWLQALPAP